MDQENPIHARLNLQKRLKIIELKTHTRFTLAQIAAECHCSVGKYELIGNFSEKVKIVMVYS